MKNLSKTLPTLKVLFVGFYLLIGGVFPFNLYANGICDRNPKVQRSIINEIPESKSIGMFIKRMLRRPVCKGITEAQLQKIKRLNLNNNGLRLTDLSRKDLAGLINLKSIDLRYNLLTSLPEGFLSDSTGLQSVIVSSEKKII